MQFRYPAMNIVVPVVQAIRVSSKNHNAIFGVSLSSVAKSSVRSSLEMLQELCQGIHGGYYPVVLISMYNESRAAVTAGSLRDIVCSKFW